MNIMYSKRLERYINSLQFNARHHVDCWCTIGYDWDEWMAPQLVEAGIKIAELAAQKGYNTLFVADVALKITKATKSEWEIRRAECLHPEILEPTRFWVLGNDEQHAYSRVWESLNGNRLRQIANDSPHIFKPL